MEEKNIVFLDVDGVLNFTGTRTMSPEGFTGILPSRVAVLKRIVDENDALIVLTSTWRECWNKDDKSLQSPDGNYLDRLMEEGGLRICDKTDGDPFLRGHNIRDWLEKNPHKGWIVIDDEVFPDYRECRIRGHLIQTGTGMNGGLKEKHILAARRLFGRSC